MFPEVGSTIVPPGREPAVLLGGLDHREPDAVLHRAAGVQVLELREELARDVAAEPLEPHDRRVPDELEHGGELAARHAARSLLRGSRSATRSRP